MSSQRLSPPSLPLPLQSRSTPAPPHPFGADARCVPCKILNNAIRSVLTESGKRPRSTTSDEVSELLGLVASAIHLAWFAASPAIVVRPKVDPRIHSALGRRFLELLRSEVVEGWRDFNVPDSELLPLLVAMERVRVTIQPNWAQTFAQQLSGNDGLALLMDVAHDLRSPLTSILVLAETLQRGQSGEVNDVQSRQLGLIYTAALGLSSVASDIIEFTQGGDQLVDQEPSAFSVTAMLESVGDIVRPIAEEKHLTVRLLAPVHDERLGHPVALSRVLLNLTTVAQEVEDGNRVELAVRDSGRGIPPAKVTTLFQPLRQESGRRGQLFSQTGLGLTICRKLVTAMKSELPPDGRVPAGAVLVPARNLTAAVRATASVIRCTRPSAPVSSVAGAKTANSTGPVRHTASEMRPARLTASASRSALPAVRIPSAG